MAVDGAARFTYERNGTRDRAAWPFDRPFYLVLAVTVGGTWGGRHGVDPDIFPARMELDWVRVYRKA